VTKVPSPNQQAEARVLNALQEEGYHDFNVLNFAEIMIRTGLERRVVRRSCRSLARKGFAAYVRGCWTEEGEPAGSGYRLTKEGDA